MFQRKLRRPLTGQFRSVSQSRLNIRFAEGWVALVAAPRDHDARTADTRLAVTDLRVDADALLAEAAERRPAPG